MIYRTFQQQLIIKKEIMSNSVLHQPQNLSDWQKTPNLNLLWARLMVAEFVRNGIDTFCIAPGSRCSPLTLAVAERNDINVIQHFDERGLAFWACGYGRATGRPAVWITSSGTAVANGLPAVIEANLEQIPMIMLTADRPPELRDTNANQTIQQVGIFGPNVRWQFDLPCPTIAIPPAMPLSTIDTAVNHATGINPGPVHINCMFREPLDLVSDRINKKIYLKSITKWIPSTAPLTNYGFTELHPNIHNAMAIVAAIKSAKRGLIIVGELRRKEDFAAILWLNEMLGWPLFPDIQSGLRTAIDEIYSAGTIPYYDQILGQKTDFTAENMPDIVIHIGGRIISKRLGLWLKEVQPTEYIHISPNPNRFNPDFIVTQKITAAIGSTCNLALEELTKSAELDQIEKTWLPKWEAVNMRITGTLDDKTGHLYADFNEPTIVRQVIENMPPDDVLFLSNSMPIRTADMFANSITGPVFIAANRGASGIDGILASAAGYQNGHNQKLTLIIGDLAFLHDINSLALYQNTPAIIIVINNDGGGIFSFLPIRKSFPDGFDQYFGTPHGFSFAPAGQLFGLNYQKASSIPDLVDQYHKARSLNGTTIIEVQTNRQENHQLHQSFLGNTS